MNKSAQEGLVVRVRIESGFLRIVEVENDKAYREKLNKLSWLNPAYPFSSVPVLRDKHQLEGIRQFMQQVEGAEKEGLESPNINYQLYDELFGVDRRCSGWNGHSNLKFPIGLGYSANVAQSSAAIEPIKVGVVRFHVCVTALYLIWASAFDFTTREPAKGLFFPDSLLNESVKAKVALLRRNAIIPIFGSSQACWNSLEDEFRDCKSCIYYWPADADISADLNAVRDFLIGERQSKSVSICHLIEAMIGPMPFFLSYSSELMFYNIFGGSIYD